MAHYITSALLVALHNVRPAAHTAAYDRPVLTGLPVVWRAIGWSGEPTSYGLYDRIRTIMAAVGGPACSPPCSSRPVLHHPIAERTEPMPSADTTEHLQGHHQHQIVDPITMRVPDACRYLGIGRSSLYLLISEGEIEIVKLGSSTLVLTASLRSLIERRRQSDLNRPGIAGGPNS